MADVSGWWTGDAMGVLVVTPVLLVLRSAHRPRNARPSRWAEALLLLGFPLLIRAAFRACRQLAGMAAKIATGDRRPRLPDTEREQEAEDLRTRKTPQAPRSSQMQKRSPPHP